MPKNNTVVVKAGDSWAKIAGQIYGDQRMYEELMRANKNISMLRPGQTLVLPQQKKNPYVSQFGAAAVGMASQFDAQGKPVSAPGSPLVPNGTNVMSPYGMWKARQNAANGGFTTPATQQTPATSPTPPANQPPAPAATTSAPTAQSVAQNMQTQGSGFNWQNPPTASTPPLSGQAAAQQWLNQQAAQQQAQAAANAKQQQQAQAAAMATQSTPKPAAFTPTTTPAAMNSQFSGWSKPQLPTNNPYQSGAMAAPATPNLPQTTQPPAQTGAVNPQSAAAMHQQAVQFAKNEALNIYSQIDAALNGVPGAQLPDTIHGSQVQSMSMFTGYSAQAIADTLLNKGYVFDQATQTLVLPGSQVTTFGVPGLPQMNAGGGNAGGASTLPEYRPPVYGERVTNFIRGRRGQLLRKNLGGGGQPQAQAGPMATYAPAPGYGTISANWRV